MLVLLHPLGASLCDSVGCQHACALVGVALDSLPNGREAVLTEQLASLAHVVTEDATIPHAICILAAKLSSTYIAPSVSPHGRLDDESSCYRVRFARFAGQGRWLGVREPPHSLAVQALGVCVFMQAMTRRPL